MLFLKFVSCLSFLYLASCTVKIYPSDFDHGSYVITQPGKYRLEDDIVFNPNPAVGGDAYDSNWATQAQLDASSNPDQFRLGFFAAIVIQAHGVELDLNGKSIVQSEEHALLQRFYAHIELASIPFLPREGPHRFGRELVSASDIKIRDGTLGRSSHHGIHGNGNQEVIISNVDFSDFEVAAIHLNGGEEVVIRDCNIGASRRDVPVYGTFSAARFIQRYIDYLHSKNSPTTLTIGGNIHTITDIRNALIDSINNVYHDVITDASNTGGFINPYTHPEEYAVFHNVEGVVDGNAYGIALNHLGVAVNGFPNATSGFTRISTKFPAKNSEIRDTTISGLKANVREILALTSNDAAAMDPVGSVWQLFNVDPLTGNPVTMTSLSPATASYTGNVIANAQLFVAKAAHAGEFCTDGNPDEMQVQRNNINPHMVSWAESGAALSTITSFGGFASFRCNGDTMFHVNKGVIGLKLDATENTLVLDVSISNVENVGASGSTACGDPLDAWSHPLAALPGYRGADARGMSTAGSKNNEIRRVSIDGVSSSNGRAAGVDVFNDSRFNMIESVAVTGVSGSVSEDFAFGARTNDNGLDLYCGTVVDNGSNNQVLVEDCP